MGGTRACAWWALALRPLHPNSQKYGSIPYPLSLLSDVPYPHARTAHYRLFGKHCGHALPHRLQVGQRGAAVVMSTASFRSAIVTAQVDHSRLCYRASRNLYNGILLVTGTFGCHSHIRKRGRHFGHFGMLVGIISGGSPYTTVHRIFLAKSRLRLPVHGIIVVPY